MLFKGCTYQYIVDVYMYCSMIVYFNTCEVCICAVQWLYVSIHVTCVQVPWLYTSIHVRCVHVLYNGCTLNTCEMCTCPVP